MVGGSMQLDPDIAKTREPEEVYPLFPNRWSRRSFSGEPLAQAELDRLFEAARWAPSSYNEQPWYFLYALPGSEHWQLFMGLLGEFNQGWCKDAGVLIALLSKRDFSQTGEQNRHHSFDAGAAWQNLALQAEVLGLSAHAMAGFDVAKAHKALNVPGDFVVDVMIAVGRPADPAKLPASLREREAPSGRKPVAAFVREGLFRQ